MTTNTVPAAAPEELENLAALAEQRAATYSMLARLYAKEVDQGLLDEMHGALYPAATGNANYDTGNYLVALYLSNIFGDSLDELAIDYSRCFIGHGNDAYSAAYPYESVYTSEKRLLMQDARDEVLAIYRANGLDKAGDWKANEDHVAAELEFMRVLCERCREALLDGDEDRAWDLFLTQRNFLEDHLAAWAPMMTEDLKNFAKTELYQGLAWLTEGYLEMDFDFLRDLIDGEATSAE